MDGNIMAYDDLPQSPDVPRLIVNYQTRNILDPQSNVIGTLTLPDTTPESTWTSVLANFGIPGLPFIIPSILSTLNINASSAVTTSSSTPAVIDSMTAKPSVGTYLAFFSGSISTSGVSANGEFGIYVDGVQLVETRRPISCALSLLGGLVSVSLNSIGVGTYTGTQVTLNGNQTIDVRFKSSNGGTIGFNERSLMLLQVKDG